jgi:hypothetical protein
LLSAIFTPHTCSPEEEEEEEEEKEEGEELV